MHSMVYFYFYFQLNILNQIPQIVHVRPVLRGSFSVNQTTVSVISRLWITWNCVRTLLQSQIWKNAPVIVAPNPHTVTWCVASQTTATAASRRRLKQEQLLLLARADVQYPRLTRRLLPADVALARAGNKQL